MLLSGARHAIAMGAVKFAKRYMFRNVHTATHLMMRRDACDADAKSTVGRRGRSSWSDEWSPGSRGYDWACGPWRAARGRQGAGRIWLS
eukprot:3228807-Pyramimonas_sp.AAC.1